MDVLDTVGLREPAQRRIVVSGSQIVFSGLSVVVLAAVAEGVGVVDVLDLFVAKGIVGVGFGDCAGWIGQVYDIAVGVVEVVILAVASCAANQICAAEIGGINGAAVLLGHHIAAVQQVGDGRQIGLLAGADALRVVAVGIACCSSGVKCFGQKIAVDSMSIGDMIGGDAVVAWWIVRSSVLEPVRYKCGLSLLLVA